MTKTRILALALLTCFGCLPLEAAGGIPVIVMAEDSDPNSIRRSSDVFHRVVSETQDLMNRYDFYVTDERFIAAKLEWRVTDRRPREELVQFVELACTAGDVTLCPRAMVLLKMRASAKRTNFGTKAWVRLSGDVFDSATNGYLGGWEAERKVFPAPHDCQRSCLEEVIGDNAREVAISLADVLRKKLAYLTRGGTGETSANNRPSISTAYLFNFRYFSQSDVLEITKVMESEFPCFEQVRGSSGDFVNYKYNYVSCATTNKLHRWMSILLTDMGFAESDFKISQSGQRDFRVEKIAGDAPPPTSKQGRFN